MQPTSSINEIAAAVLGTAGELWLLNVEVGEGRVHALVDSGAARSFVAPSLVAELALDVEDLDEEVRFRVASGEEMVVTKVVKHLAFRVSGVESWADFLLATIPYKLILGSDWLDRESVVWDFGKQHLLVHRKKGKHVLPVVASSTTTTNGSAEIEKEDKDAKEKRLADEARRLMMEEIQQLNAPDADAMVRPAPKRYKNFKNRSKRIPIKQLVKELQNNSDLE